jgi:penicillin-binding protein 1A
MTSSRKTTATPAYKRVQSRHKKVTYRQQGSAGWLRFAGGAVKTKIKRLFWSRATLVTLLSLTATACMLIGGIIAYYSATMPDIAGLAAAKEQAGVEIIGAEDVVVARYGQITGQYIPFDALPKALVQAVLATEDRRFFEHHGVDWLGISRAVVKNIMQGRVAQGGSSITQQLAKNVFLSSERTLERKIKELIVAYWLERKFTKQEILAIYLNRVYFGAGNYGIDAASRYYFNKQVAELDVLECAMLAGLLKAPSRYNPTANLERTVGRTSQVLLNMVDAGMITPQLAQTEIARLQSGEKQLKQRSFEGERYYTDWIYEQLPDYIEGELTEDVVVTTSFNANVQQALQQGIDTVMTEEVRNKQKVGQVAGLVMQPNGAVVAMVGGLDYNDSQYNRAVQAKRQSGSAFKMFVYLAAMEKGYTPDMIMVDAPVQIGKWRPQNYKGEYKGNVTLTQAMSESINTIAVKLSQYVGINAVKNAARRLGVKSPLHAVPSLALGAADVSLKEIVTAYAHLANGGRAVAPYGIMKVVRKRDGAVLYQRSSRDNFNDIVVVQPENVAKMNVLLQSVVTSGTARGAAIGRPVAGKTGTTSDYKDAWFIGYTPQLVAGIWVGNDKGEQMSNVTGGSLPARIWAATMKAAHANLPVQALPTDYYVKVPELPWLQPAAPSVPVQPDESFELQPSFWDKLFDGEGKVEHEYPSERRLQ